GPAAPAAKRVPPRPPAGPHATARSRRAFQPQTVAQMAAGMGHARQSVQRVADVLQREGLIAYRPHPTDRRTKLVELTPQGHKVLGEVIGMTFLQADIMDDALGMVRDHHHLQWAESC